MTRIDQLVVQRGLAPSRSAARRLIEAGAVRWLAPSGWTVPSKAGEALPEDCAIEIVDDAELRFVSRGGLKLDGALDRLGIEADGLACLDVGQSTGGFTDVLLHRGAAHVVGIDVGHGQLHPRLAADPRVSALEGFHARALSLASLRAALATARSSTGQRAPHDGSDASRPGTRPPEHAPAASAAFAGFDLAVADVSFIALSKLLDAIAGVLRPGGVLLALVKPQFEAGRAHVGKGGIVRDAAVHAAIERDVRAAAAQAGLAPRAWIDSPIAGGDGNREFFLHAVRDARIPAPDPTP